MQEIPIGLCQCGCGQKTKISTYNCKPHGRIKGQPIKCVKGHYPKPKPRPDYIVDEKGCWVWGRKLNRTSRGIVKNRISTPASRYYWEKYNGEIPSGQVVCHKCDNPPCVNPEHLFLGTYADNSRDMVEKGRSCKGEKNPIAKLKVDDIIEIRNLYSTGLWTLKQLAPLYNVSFHAIHKVIKRKNWGWLD